MGNIKESLKSQTGFTIIELMIALFVLSLLVVGYIGANVMAQRNTEDMNERTVAIQDANRVIEQIRDASNTEGWDFPADTVAAYPDGASVGGFEHLSDEVVTVSYDDPNGDPLHVAIAVTWTSYTGRVHTETVETYITQRG
jgi:prepilin-type N-terminal cleavage/methylation domain-containing protein